MKLLYLVNAQPWIVYLLIGISILVLLYGMAAAIVFEIEFRKAQKSDNKKLTLSDEVEDKLDRRWL